MAPDSSIRESLVTSRRQGDEAAPACCGACVALSVKVSWRKSADVMTVVARTAWSAAQTARNGTGGRIANSIDCPRPMQTTQTKRTRGARAGGSHPEHAVPRRALARGGGRRGEAEPQHGARVARVDDAVVPETRGREEGIRLAVDLLLHHLPQRLVLLHVEWPSGTLRGLATDDREHAGELLGAHHRDAVVRPGEDEARVVGAARHAVVPGAVRRTDHDREMRHRAVRDRVDELGAVLDDPALLVSAADHEAGDVLQEDDRRVGLVAELDELRPLLRRLGEEHAVVGEEADRIAVDV